MTRFVFIITGILLAVIGGIKVWFHINTGTVLTLEGCQGGVFTMDLGPSSAHCWGCYVAAMGLVLLLGSNLVSYMKSFMHRNTLNRQLEIV